MNTPKQLVVTVVCALAMSSVYAQGVTICPQVKIAINNLYAQLEKFGAADKLGKDFMTIYEGMKNDQWEYAEEMYTNAIQNGIEVARPEHMLHLEAQAEAARCTPICPKNTHQVTRYVQQNSNHSHAISVASFPVKNPDDSVSGTLIIDQPGSYYFAESIVFSADMSLTAIEIASSDVTIDLSTHKLETKAPAADTLGFNLVPGNHSITITNGSICGFETAINAFVPPAGDGEEQLTLSNISLTDLNLSYNGVEEFLGSGSAIKIRNFSVIPATTLPTEFVISDVTVKRVRANDNRAVTVVDIIAVDNLVLEEVQVNNATHSLDASIYPYQVAYCRNLFMENCQGNGTKSVSPNLVFDQSGAAFFVGNQNCLVSHCQFNDTFGESNIIIAPINLSLCTNAIFDTCQFNNTTGGDGGPDAVIGSTIVDAIHLSDDVNQEFSASGIEFLHCQFNGVTRRGSTPGLDPRGQMVTGAFLISNVSTVFKNCEAVNIGTENPEFYAAGYMVFSQPSDPTPPFGDINNVVFSHCLASDIKAPRDAFGFFSGALTFEDAGKPARANNFIYDTCVAQRIQSFSSEDTAAGIAHLYIFPIETVSFELNNIFIRDCRISDVQGGSPELSAGVRIESTQRPVLCGNSISDCINGVILSGSHELGFTNCGLIQENKVDNCTFTGYRDDSKPTTSAFLSNTAFKNGRCHSDNYRINWGGKAPVCKGRLDKYPICERPYNLSLLGRKKK